MKLITKMVAKSVMFDFTVSLGVIVPIFIGRVTCTETSSENKTKVEV